MASGSVGGAIAGAPGAGPAAPRRAARVASNRRPGARSPSPVAWTRRRVAAASSGPPARARGESLLARAAPPEDDDYYGGQTEVMRSVAERVKAARELAKRLASKEEELAAQRAGGAPPAPPPAALVNDAGEEATESDSYDEDATAAAASDLIGEYNGDVDAAAAAAAAAAKLAEMEAAAAEAQASAFAARAVSDMDEAVTRIRQEAAKRVAAAERERDRARAEAQQQIAEGTSRAAALEETLRRVTADAEAKVRAAEQAQGEWEILAETSRMAKESAEEQLAAKTRIAEEAARVGIAEADQRAAAAEQRAAEAEERAKRDVEAAKIVQEEITRQEKEKADLRAQAAIDEANAKIARAEEELEAAQLAAIAEAGAARTEAEEILKQELAQTEEALNAAEEIAAIEVAAAEEAAAVLVSEKEEEMRAAIEAAEAKAKREAARFSAEAQKRVAAAEEKAERAVAEAKAEAEEAAKTAEAIAAAKDAVAAAVATAEADVASARTEASDAKIEIERISAAAETRVAELSADFERKIEEARREAREKADAEIETATAKRDEAEKKVDAAIAAAEKRAEDQIQRAEQNAAEKIEAAKARQKTAVAEAKADAAALVETAKEDAQVRIAAAQEKVKKAKADAKKARQEAKQAAEWEVAAAKAEAEAEAALERERAAEERASEAERRRAEAELEASRIEALVQEAKNETELEKQRVEEALKQTEAAVAAAVERANDVSAVAIEEARKEAGAGEEAARAELAAAREAEHAAINEAAAAKNALADAVAEKETEIELIRMELAAANERAEEAARVRDDLIAGDEMERAIEFEKRVAAATAENEAALNAERERADAAETSLANANYRIQSLTSELETATAEMDLVNTEEMRAAKGSEVSAEIARLQVALDAKDAEIAALNARLAGDPNYVAQQQQQAVDPNTGAPLNPDGTPMSEEEQELASLLNEVMALKGEVEGGAESVAGAQAVSSIATVRTMETVYAEAYHATLASRKAARRKEAEAWAATQVTVVASMIPEVYHWLGGGARHGDSAIIYNRRNPNGLGDGGQCFMHMGYNGWQGDPRQVAMRPLQHDHPVRTELWLNDKGGDWWIAEPVYVHPEASVLDFVFSDGEGEYDNFGGKDYHSPVGTEHGDPAPEIDHVGEREAQLEAEFGHLDAQFAEKAAKRAERQFVSRQSFDAKIVEDVAVAKVVTLPPNPVAGQEIEIFYRHSPQDMDDLDAPLRGASDVFVQGGWNRWTHGEQFGPTRMSPAQSPPGGEGAAPALVARVTAPPDAHCLDFVFTDDARSMSGRYDSKNGLDYHAPIFGASGGSKPTLRIVHVAVEMAPIAKVGGMGDVVTALSRAVIEKGHSVEVILPKYDCMDHAQINDLQLVDSIRVEQHSVTVYRGEVEEVPVTFLQPDTGHFDVGCIYGRGDDHVRFEFFSKCALAWMQHVGDMPDIVHAHDWSTSHCVFARRSSLPAGAATVLTIHNLQFGQDLIGRAMQKATFATTVSPTYAEEIKGQGAVSPNAGKMVGIRNGIDVELWDPLTDELLTQNYNAETWSEGKSAARRQLAERLGMTQVEPHGGGGEHGNEPIPLVGVVARLTQQKGIHLIKHACYRALESGAMFVLLGSSPDGNVQNDFNNMAADVGQRFPGKSGFVFAYDEPLSHLVYAAADMLLVPSMFEPCGLTQLIAMRYGTVPVVRRTGGLRDTVFDVDEDVERAQAQGLRCNGYSFSGDQAHDIEYALDRAMMTYRSDQERWKGLVTTIMRQDWGWTDPADTYVEHYWKAAKSMKDAYFVEQARQEVGR